MNEMTEFNLFILPMRALRTGFRDGMTDQLFRDRAGRLSGDEPVGSLRGGGFQLSP